MAVTQFVYKLTSQLNDSNGCALLYIQLPYYNVTIMLYTIIKYYVVLVVANYIIYT